MRKWVIVGIATAAVIGTGLVVGATAQTKRDHLSAEHRFERLLERAEFGEHRGWRHRRGRGMSAEDRAAFLDARLAAVKAGLRLTPEQEKHWGPVETTVRELGKKWSERAAERREEMQKRRQARRDGERIEVDPVERIRVRAERLAERAADMKRFADTAQPLYASLDDNQKRRLFALVPGGRHHMRHGWQRGGDDRPQRNEESESEERR